MPTRLTRNEFVQSLDRKSLDVGAAQADPALAGVNVARADLNQDGKVSGATEAAALFKEVDRFDTNGDSGSVDLTAASGQSTRAAVVATALQSRAMFATSEPAPSAPTTLGDAALRKALGTGAGLPLQRGASGDGARAVQYALARLGYAVGKVDGAFGEASTRAVQAFQREAGLPVSGQVDARTLAALDARVAATDLRSPAERSGDPLAHLTRAAVGLPKLPAIQDRSQPVDWKHPEIQKAYGQFVGAYWQQLKTNRVETDCKTLSLFFMDQFRAKAKADLGVDLPRPRGLPEQAWLAATPREPQGFFSRFETMRTVRPGYENAQAVQRLDPQASMLSGTNLRYPGVDANMASRAVNVTSPWSAAQDNRGDARVPEVPVQKLSPGDVIFMDHTGDGRVDHMVNVVDVKRDAGGRVTQVIIATGSFDDVKDELGSTAPAGIHEVNNYTEEVTIDLDAQGRVADSKVTWSSEPRWLVEPRYSARTLLMEMKPGGKLSVGRWAQPG